MKRNYTIRSLVLLLAIFFSTNVGFAQTFSGGDGSGNNPYQLGTPEDLIELYSTPSVWGGYKHYQLIADIDMDGQMFHPLGYQIQGGALQPFTGTFDGNHHVIKNLTVTPHDDQTSVGGGFIGISGDLTIKNLGLINVNVPFKGVAERVGGLVGFLQWNSTVENCFVVGGSVSGNGRVGGLIGNMTGLTLMNSFAAVHVDANWGDNGGLVGSNHSAFVETGSISNCAVYGTVVNSKPALGLHNDLFSNIYCISTTGATDDENPAVTILTPEELTVQSNYRTLDFSATGAWEMKENSFAVLKNFPADSFDGLLTFVPIPLKVTSDGSTPIAGANVSMDTDGDGTDENYTTDANGLLSKLILPGDYDYTVSATDYLEQTGSVTAEIGGTPKVITLIPEAVEVFTATFNVTNSKDQILEGATISLTDNASYDETGVTDANGQLVFDQLLAGTYNYSISKDLHITGTGSITITDQSVIEDVVLLVDNKAPVADAGQDATYASNTVVELNGAESSDVNGDNLSFEWTVPTGITDFSDVNAARPTFTAPVVSQTTEYPFTLTVSDGELSSTDIVTITVKGAIVKGTEMLVNGGFEDGLDVAWSGVTSDFEISSEVPTSNTTSTQSVRIAVSQQIDNVETANGSYFPITVGKTYVLSGKIKAEHMDMTALNFRLMPHNQWGDKAKVAVTKPGVNWGGPQAILGEWVAFEETITVGTNYFTGAIDGQTYESRLHLQSAPDFSTDDVLYIDDLSLVEYDIELEVFAGEDQEVESNSTVNLIGSHNSSEDLTISWTALEGIELTNANTLTPSFTAPVVVTTTPYTFTLNVQKGSLVVTDEVVVTVNPVLQANAGQDQEVQANAVVTLDASASTPVGATFEWTAPEGIELSDNTNVTPTFTAPNVTETTPYTFTVKAMYANSESTDDVIVTVHPNAVANAGADQEIQANAVVTLDASASTPVGATFEWTAPEGIELSDNTNVTPTFTAPDVTETSPYTFTVKAMYAGSESTDDVIVTVHPNAVANAGEDQVVQAGDVVALDASASTPADASFEWSAPEGITLSDVNAVKPTFTAPNITETTPYTFTVKAMYAGSESTDEVVITIHPNALANAGQDQEVQAENVVTLDASASTPTDASFEWIAPEGITLSDVNAVAPTFTAPDVTVTTPYTFTVKAIYEDSESTDDVVITVHPNAVANAGEDQVVQAEDVVTLDASASTPSEATFEWTAPEGITLSDVNAIKPTFPAPNVTETTPYTFTVKTMYANSESTDEVQITVNPNVVANAGDDQTVIEGVEVLLDASASTPADASFEWTSLEGIELSDVNAVKPTFTAPDVDGSTNYTFTVKVSYAALESTDQVVVTVNPKDQAVADAGEDQVVQAEDLVTLDASASSPVDVTFEWTTPEGITLSDVNTAKPTFTAPNVTVTTPYTFTVKAMYEDSESTDDVIVTVHPNATANAGQDQQVQVNTLVTLDASASTPNEATFEWTAPEGITLSEVNTAKPTFTAPNVTVTTPYTFTVKAIYEDSESTDDVVITVHPNAVADAGEDQVIQANDVVTLDASASTPNEATFEWTAPEGITLSDPKVDNPTFTAPNVTVTTPYTFTVKAIYEDSESTDDVVITVHPNAVADAGEDQVIQANDVVTLDASASTPTDATFEWTAPEGITLSEVNTVKPTFTAPNVTVTTPYTFTVKAIYEDSESTDDVVITVHPNAVADAGEDQVVQANNVVTLDASASTPTDATFEWTAPEGITLSEVNTVKPTFTAPNVTETTPYTFTVKAIYADSESTDEVVITVHPNTAANAGEDQVIQANDVVTLDASASTPTDATFEWTAPEGITLSEVNTVKPTFTAPNVTVTTPYTFTVKAIYADSESTDEVVITVHPNAVADAGEDQVVQANNVVTLDASASTPTDATFEWTAPEGITLSDVNAVKPTFTAPVVSDVTEFIFSLSTTYGNSKSTDDVVITVYPEVFADAGEDQVAIEGTVVTLQASSLILADEAEFNWITPEEITLSDPTLSNASFTAPEVDETTVYTLEVEVTVNGFVSTDEVEITVNPKVISSSDEVETILAEVYPNPTKGAFSIELQEKANISIVTLSGKLIKTVELRGGKHTLDISSLTAGVYLIQVQAESRSQTIKLVKE